MKNFPLRLRDYFFTRVNVESNPQYLYEESTTVTDRVRAFIRKQDEDRVYSCTVRLELDDDNSQNFPYKYHFEIFGIFEGAEGETEKIISQIAREQGTSLLIGAIREKLSSLTGDGPWPRFVLNFIPLANIAFFAPAGDKEHKKTSDKKPSTRGRKTPVKRKSPKK